MMAAPMALSAAFPMFAGSTGLAGLFSKMNPMAANALKQSLLGYGTAALSGSRRPGRAAMAAGLTSIPFSYMSAANAAKGFNEQYGDMTRNRKNIKWNQVEQQELGNVDTRSCKLDMPPG
jgi:hypothetical protein